MLTAGEKAEPSRSAGGRAAGLTGQRSGKGMMQAAFVILGGLGLAAVILGVFSLTLRESSERISAAIGALTKELSSIQVTAQECAGSLDAMRKALQESAATQKERTAAVVNDIATAHAVLEQEIARANQSGPPNGTQFLVQGQPVPGKVIGR
jgi:hypothetical protein